MLLKIVLFLPQSLEIRSKLMHCLCTVPHYKIYHIVVMYATSVAKTKPEKKFRLKGDSNPTELLSQLEAGHIVSHISYI